MKQYQHTDIRALTGLRFFAAFAIVAYHSAGSFWFPADLFKNFPLNQAVSFFFVLSGFILQHSYRSRIQDIRFQDFALQRFFRIWPCHIAVILLILIVHGKGLIAHFYYNNSLGQIAANIFLLQSWGGNIKVAFLLNSPAWSISTELFFYLMFPWLCKQSLISPLRPLLYGFLMTLAWSSATWLYMPNGDMGLLMGINPLARIFEFTVGISAYEYFFRTKRHVPTGSQVEIAVVLLAVVSVATVRFWQNLTVTISPVQFQWWFGAAGSCLIFAAMILVISRGKGWISQFLSSKPMVFAGEISFALYLVHLPILYYLKQNAPWYSDLGVTNQMLLFTVLIFGFSSALHLWVEKPFMTFIKKYTHRPKEKNIDLPLFNAQISLRKIQGGAS